MKIIYISPSIILLIVVFLLLTGSIPLDIYLIPLILSGIIAFINIISCIQKPESFTNIYLVVWIILFVNSFIAPIIHFRHNFWLDYMIWYPKNWNMYAFYLSSIYLIGILIFNFLLNIAPEPKEYKTKWIFKPSAARILLFFLFLSFTLQTFLYFRFGGITEYVNSYIEGSKSEFEGMGIFFIFSETFPSLFIFYFIITNKDKDNSGLKTFLFLLLLFISCLYFGGLRGSRSNTLFTMIQGAISMHLFVYQFKKSHMIYFTLFFMLFMFIGRVYKDRNFENIADYRQNVEVRHNKTTAIEDIIIGDLSRYAINCYQIYRLDESDNYEYKYGQTYIGGVLTFFPMGAKIRDHFDITQRTDAATELLYTSEAGYKTPDQKNSRIYGLVGEWFLNFGVLSFIIPYLLMAVVLMKIRKHTIFLDDARAILLPIIIILTPNLILADFNNICFFTVKRFLTILFVLYIITYREEQLNKNTWN